MNLLTIQSLITRLIQSLITRLFNCNAIANIKLNEYELE